MSLRPIFKVQQRQLYLIIINILFLQHKNKGTKYYTEKYKVKSRSSQAHLRQTGSHCASPAPNFRKENDPGSWSAHSIQMGQLLLTMSRGRGVPRDIVPAQGTCLAASNILASLTLLHIKWSWSPPPWPDLEMNAPALSIYSKVPQAHLPTHIPELWSHPRGSHVHKPVAAAHSHKHNWKLSVTSCELETVI